jgi:hypothetical protein
MLTFVLCDYCITRLASFCVSRSYVLSPAAPALGEVAGEVSVGRNLLVDRFLPTPYGGLPDAVPSVECASCVAISIGLRELPAPLTFAAIVLAMPLRLLKGDRASSFSRSSKRPLLSES